MGPFELMDLTGVDVSHPVMESIYDQFYQEPRYRPSYALRQRYIAGLYGRKAGRGFYSYRDGKQEPVPPRPVPEGRRMPVWIDAAEVAWRRELAQLVEAADWPLDANDKPGENSLCLVAPLGEDATTSALARGLDARRTVAVDMLFGLARRRSLMTTPVTAPDFLASAHALLTADGAPASRLHDSPGFVAQRVVAMIVNIGCDIAQQRIATPEDIDDAVTLGLGYPRGPLAMGDGAGPARILKILQSLLAFTGDPRYRPSPWLSRRARLGVSLLTHEG
jgi:3-hydroxybutyryl-CoA dehydrogenase